VANVDESLQSINAHAVSRDHNMAKLVVTFKVLPTGVDVSLETLGKNVESVLVKYGKIYKQRLQPVAFGINALVFELIMEDKEGGTDAVETELKDVPELSDVQVTDITRVVDIKF